MADAANPIKPDYTTQSPAVYKANIDAGFEVLDRSGWAYACYEKATPDMQVRLYPGSVHYALTLVENAEQNTGTITAPSGNPRIDRVYIDHHTGVVGVITGAEAASPTPPALSAGQIPIADILLDNSPATTTITNSLITDRRNLHRLGMEIQSDEIKAGAVNKTAIGTDAVGRDELDNSVGSSSGSLGASAGLDIATNDWAYIYFFGGAASVDIKCKTSGTNGLRIQNDDAKSSQSYDIRWRLFDT